MLRSFAPTGHGDETDMPLEQVSTMQRVVATHTMPTEGTNRLNWAEVRDIASNPGPVSRSAQH